MDDRGIEPDGTFGPFVGKGNLIEIQGVASGDFQQAKLMRGDCVSSRGLKGGLGAFAMELRMSPMRSATLYSWLRRLITYLELALRGEAMVVDSPVDQRISRRPT